MGTTILLRSSEEALDRYDNDDNGRPRQPSSPSSYPKTSTSTDTSTTILLPQNGYDSWNDHDKNSIISQESSVTVSSSVIATTSADVNNISMQRNNILSNERF